MFSGYHDLESSDRSSSSPTSQQSSPLSSTDSPARSPAAPTNTKARMQDKQIEKGKAVMMRDYIPTHINIMLYGESGLGKTTCIKNLIGNWEVETMGLAFKNTGRTSLELFRQSPDNLKIQLKPLRSEEANRDLLITFQDMPGWGDDINLVNSLRTVVHFLLRQRQLDFHAQDGGFPLHGAPNHRGALQNAITVCLYFVPPHRIKPVDWIMMSAIGKMCAVVPIIAKADTFTAKEMEDFKKEIMEVITAAAMQPPSTPQGGRRTSGCGAATAEGIQSTMAANSRPAPMTPAAAAARMTPPGSGSNDNSSTRGSSDGSRLMPRSNSSDGSKPAATAATTAAATAAKAAGINHAKLKPENSATSSKATAANSKTSPRGAAATAATAATDSKTSPRDAAAAAAPSKAGAVPVSDAVCVGGPGSPPDLVARVGPPAASSSKAGGLVSHGSLTLLGEGELESCIELARDLGLQTYAFSQFALQAIDADVSKLPPFAVIGSPDMLPAGAPEVEGMCCPVGQGSAMPRELWPSAGEPFRRYAWGTAFPLNRSHSDLIILKQLLTGHCNTAIYDLLDDSWKRACMFAEKYRKVLLTKSSETVRELLATSRLLDPMVDEVCNIGRLVPLEDRLRDEEQKKLQAELERAGSRLRELEETVRAQRRALSSMQQQLATVLQEKSQNGFLKRLKRQAAA